MSPSPLTADSQTTTISFIDASAKMLELRTQMERVIVGQTRLLDRLLIALLAKGHCLLEGLPGLAKTLAVETLASTVQGSFHRIQFTPDLLPTDIIGTRIYKQKTEQFDIEIGPIFANFVLADEINRAPAKVQSALLEVMAERHVTIGPRTIDVPDPFLVLATQNPLEQEGVYPLPEAQRDRFMFQVVVEYPSFAEELDIVNRMNTFVPRANPILTIPELKAIQQLVARTEVSDQVKHYAVSLVHATRNPEQFGLVGFDRFVTCGASPRASLSLVQAAKALALIEGTRLVTPQHIFDVAPEVLRHRLILSFDALAEGLQVDSFLDRLLGTVPVSHTADIHLGR